MVSSTSRASPGSASAGPSVHDEHTGEVTPIPTNQGGALLANQLITEGHRATVDWGKVDYPAGTPGQIVGVTYWATTRNEFDARFQAHEDYEPGIPDVTVLLETPGPDGEPNTADDVVVNQYVTDHWQHPNDCRRTRRRAAPCATPPAPTSAAQMNPAIGPNCLETPITGEQTKDGAFDGGYAFADYCRGRLRPGTPAPATTGPTRWTAGRRRPTSPTWSCRRTTTDTRACNPANPDGLQEHQRPHGTRPRWRPGLPVPRRPGGGRQRRPRQQVHPGHPAAGLHR